MIAAASVLVLSGCASTVQRSKLRAEERMSERKQFVSWFESTWRDAEVALHNGDAAPRFATWSDRKPLTLFGAWFTATDPDSVHGVFRRLAKMFSKCTASSVELIAADVSGDLA